MQTTLGQWPPLGRVERKEQDPGEAQKGASFWFLMFSFFKNKLKQAGKMLIFAKYGVGYITLFFLVYLKYLTIEKVHGIYKMTALSGIR